MVKSSLIATLACITGLVGATPIRQRDSTSSATVDASANNGAASLLAGGIIFGIPVPDDIPDERITDLGLKYGRFDCDPINFQGVDTSQGGYKGCIAWITEQVKNLNKLTGARSDFMPAGFGGLWHTYLNGSTPCANDDCTGWIDFVHQWSNDVKDNGLAGLVNMEPFNEPDLFPGLSLEQFIKAWNLAVPIIRSILPNTPIVGPSIAAEPSIDNDFWNQWMSGLVGNNSVPDKMCFHVEYQGGGAGGDDIAFMIPQYNILAQSHNIPTLPFHLNEYGTQGEQTPSSGAWFISRFERMNVEGQRGNWGDAGGLNENLSGLVDGSQSGYPVLPEWYMYKFYNQNMTGTRLATTTASDGFLDVFAVKNQQSITALAGSHGQQGSYSVVFNNVASVFGSGVTSLQAAVTNFPPQLGGPTTLSQASVNVANDAVTISYTITDDSAVGIVLTPVEGAPGPSSGANGGCQPGYGQSADGSCYQCAYGSYSVGGSAQCSACPADSNQPNAGASTCECTGANAFFQNGACVNGCQPGYGRAADGTCYQCAYGSYSVGGSAQCAACPAGSNQPNAGASTCECTAAGASFQDGACITN